MHDIMFSTKPHYCQVNWERLLLGHSNPAASNYTTTTYMMLSPVGLWYIIIK